MKKKFVIILLSVIFVWSSLIITDCILPIKFNKKPLFSIWKEQEKDGGSGTYVGIGYSIYLSGNFDPEQKTSINYIQVKVLFIPVYTYSK